MIEHILEAILAELKIINLRLEGQQIENKVCQGVEETPKKKTKTEPSESKEEPTPKRRKSKVEKEEKENDEEPVTVVEVDLVEPFTQETVRKAVREFLSTSEDIAKAKLFVKEYLTENKFSSLDEMLMNSLKVHGKELYETITKKSLSTSIEEAEEDFLGGLI